MFLQAVDTVYLQTPRDTLSMAADGAIVILCVAVVVLALSALVILLRTSRAFRRFGRTAEKKVDPLLERSRSVAANLEFITATLRTDIEGLHRSVRALTDRLKQASDHMEDRIEEFNALMEVVQGEAEDVFIDTAATARGVRAGASRLVRSGRTETAPTTSAVRVPSADEPDPLTGS